MAGKISDETKIYGLLEKMLKSAQMHDGKAVRKLNGAIEPLILKRYQLSNDALGREYDNCRQSCLLPFTSLPDCYDSFMADAKKRLSKLRRY